VIGAETQIRAPNLTFSVRFQTVAARQKNGNLGSNQTFANPNAMGEAETLPPFTLPPKRPAPEYLSIRDQYAATAIYRPAALPTEHLQ